MNTKKSLPRQRAVILLMIILASGISGILIDLLAFGVLASSPTTGDPGYTALIQSVIVLHVGILGVGLLLAFVYERLFGASPVLLLIRELQENISQQKNAEHNAALSEIDPKRIMTYLSLSASELAERVFLRAAVYLYVGVFVAFVGLAFFFWRSLTIPSFPAGNDPYQTELSWLLHTLVPSFGILFFIELIAFFFLRQYRTASDEFRYYDAIRRNRQESLVVLKMFAEYPERVSTHDVIAAMQIYSGTGKLATGETTEMLESRRLQRDEIALFEKFAEILAALRQKKEEKLSNKK